MQHLRESRAEALSQPLREGCAKLGRLEDGSRSTRVEQLELSYLERPRQAAAATRSAGSSDQREEIEQLYNERRRPGSTRACEPSRSRTSASPPCSIPQEA